MTNDQLFVLSQVLIVIGSFVAGFCFAGFFFSRRIGC